MTAKRAAHLAAILSLAAAVTAVAPAVAGERADLKERFAERYPTLVKLKRAGLVGETFEGLVEAVKPEYASRRVGGAKSPTVARFLGDENRDRRRLYQLIAEETKTEPSVVARRNARRLFKKAGPEEYLKPRPGKWVKKKDL